MKILLLEDDAQDSQLIMQELRSANLRFVPHRVCTKNDFLAALESFSPDLILSDNSLPGFDGLAALQTVREKGFDTPFIFVSGTIGEDAAIESLRRGGTDYVIKGRLSRLGPAVQRALRETEERMVRKRAEAELQAAEAKFRSLVEQSLVGIYIIRDGRFAYVNPRFAEVFGYTQDEVSQLGSIFDLVAAEDRERVAENLRRQAVDDLKAVNYAFHGTQKDGSHVHVEVHGARTEYNGGPAVIGTLLDVTERDRAEEALRSSEEQLRQSHKMEAVGRLAGGIAHDFNNLLTAITGYSELLLDRVGPESHLRKDIEEVRKAGERAAGLTRQLLAFSRKQVLESKILDLNEVVSNVEKMLTRVIGEDVELLTDLQRHLGQIKADPGQIEQVILNLAVNARDAMPNGGKLMIETADVDLSQSSDERDVGVPPGCYVRLVASDTGCGMDEEVQSRIFEPFFTTKEQGKGTGLGLSMVYGIVQQSGGHILVHSLPDSGTTFKIFFPRINESSDIDRPEEPADQFPEGCETVLLVEDDDVVRGLIHEILRGFGYRVLVSRSGDEALSICERHQGRIHLVVTDVVMPRLNGQDLIRRMLSIRPDVKALFVSGYAQETILERGRQETAVAFLPKPFTPAALLRKARELLDA